MVSCCSVFGDLKNCSFLYFQYFACHMHQNVCPLFWSIHKFSRLLLTISHPDAIKSMAFVLVIIYLFQMQEFQSYIVSHGYSNRLCNYYAKNTNFDPPNNKILKTSIENLSLSKWLHKYKSNKPLTSSQTLVSLKLFQFLGFGTQIWKFGPTLPDLMKNLNCSFSELSCQ